ISRVGPPSLSPSGVITITVVPLVPWSIASKCRLLVDPPIAPSLSQMRQPQMERHPPDSGSPPCPARRAKNPSRAGCPNAPPQLALESNMARLLLATPDGERTVELRPRNTLGRHPDNSIQLLDKIVSKEHCVIEQRGSEFVLRDLGSLNGTFVDG